MIELALELSEQSQDDIDNLVKHYKAKSRAAIVSKAIALLKLASHVEQNKGELIARRGMNETRLNI